MLKRLCKYILALAIAAASAGTARADAILDLKPPTLDTAAGGTVEFAGTLTNTGDADLYLNGDVIILPFPDLTVDDSPFFNNSPLLLPFPIRRTRHRNRDVDGLRRAQLQIFKGRLDLRPIANHKHR